MEFFIFYNTPKSSHQESIVLLNTNNIYRDLSTSTVAKIPFTYELGFSSIIVKRGRVTFTNKNRFVQTKNVYRTISCVIAILESHYLITYSLLHSNQIWLVSRLLNYTGVILMFFNKNMKTKTTLRRISKFQPFILH